jgi:biopolymer transport protein ExbD
MSEINVTPLVDVMLVLLIIFMITAPLMSHKTKIELPQATYDKRKVDPPAIAPVTIAVTESGALFFNDEPVTKGLLESKLSVLGQLGDQQPQVNIRGDKTAPYRYVKEVVDLAQAQGMRKVGFVATKERN